MLDLEAWAIRDRFVGAPRPSDFRRRRDAIRLLRCERVDHLFDFRDPIDWGDQYRIANRDHRNSFESNGGDERSAIAPQQRITRIYCEDIAGRHIPVAILVSKLPDSIPRAYVRPLHVDWHDYAAGGLLHDRIIDGDGLGAVERLSCRADERFVGDCLCDGTRECIETGRQELAHLVQQSASLHEEYPAVPEETAAGEIPFGGFGVRLLHEPRN